MAAPSSAAPCSDSQTAPEAEVPLVKVLYLFAGRKRHSDVAAYLKAAEAKGSIRLILKEFDIERSPDHDLTSNSLWQEVFQTLEEGKWVVIVSPPCNTFSRARFQRRHPGPRPLRTKHWPRGFPWLSNFNKQKVAEANFFVDQCLVACETAANHEGYFILEHPEDLGAIDDETPGSIWQWTEVLDLMVRCKALCFALHQCKFGALTPKPTRILTNFAVSDDRCYMSLPKFDKHGVYQGPLPRKCGHRHTHSLIGKTGQRWNTSPSAAYPPGLCEFFSNLIIHAFASFGGGQDDPVGTRAPKRPIDSEPSGLTGKSRKIDLEEAPQVVEDSEDDGAKSSYTEQQQHQQQLDDEFDPQLCYNAGAPIQVEWDHKSHGFIDGFGLCSPTRWKPFQRGVRRSDKMNQLAEATFNILSDCVSNSIADVRKEAFKLVTGKLGESPFSETTLAALRSKWAELLPDPKEALVLDQGQPFLLRGLAQWLRIFEDPDVHWLVDESDSFSTGVYLGVDRPLPRSSQVFPAKTKHRSMDETTFCPIAENYPSLRCHPKSWRPSLRRKNRWAGCILRSLVSSSNNMGIVCALPQWQPLLNQMDQYVRCMMLHIR